MELTKYDKQRTRYKRLLKEYTRQLLNEDKFDWIKLKNVYNKTIPNDYAEYHLKKIVRQRQFQQMTIEEIEQIYKEAGITRDYIVKEESRILKDAQNSNNLRIQLDVVNNWRDSLDLKPVKQQQITTTQTDYIKYLDKDTGKQITAKQTKQLKQADLDTNDTQPSTSTTQED